MSSRDADNRTRGTSGQRPADSEPPSAPRSRFLDVDPADIDRYLSGRPPRSQSGQAGQRTRRESPDSEARPTTGSGTARQLEKLQQSVNRANRSRQHSPATDLDQTPTDFDDSTTTGQSPRSQTAYASQSGLRSNRRRSYMREDPYVSGYEDEPLPEVEEPVRAVRRSYDVEELEETWDVPVQRQRRRTTRQARPAISRPNIQRPSLPPSIANADIVNDASALVFVGISTLGLAAMAIVVANRIGRIDPVIATHVSASGVFEHFASRSTVWQLPLLATVLTLMNLVAAWFVSPLDRFASRFLLATGVVVQFVAWVALVRILW